MENDSGRDFTTRMTSAGQVTIPKKYREALALKPGQHLNVSVDNGKLVFTPMELVHVRRSLENNQEEHH
jgi:AbrB family looped-hinge helix DNA binding protein